MKFIVEIDNTPELSTDIIEDLLENGLATHVHAEEYHAPLQEEKTKEYPEPDKMLNPNMMLFVGGSDRAFRCECGANVFSQKEDEKGVYYECHGCWTVYREGE